MDLDVLMPERATTSVEQVRLLLVSAGEAEPAWFELAAPAIEQLGDADGLEILDATVGWLRLGDETEAIVSSLFVVTGATLFVAPQDVELDMNHISLPDVVSIDLIDGLDLPLEAIEVRLANDWTVLLGWPERFCESVVGVLQSVAGTPLEDGVATGGDETELQAGTGSILDTHPDVIDAFFGTGDSPDTPSGVTFSASSGPDDASSERGIQRQASGVFTFRDSVLLVDSATSARRKKKLTLVADAAGLSAVANGFGHWSTTIGVADITKVVIAGDDEVMYTHSLKISEHSTALIVERSDSMVAFEIPDMAPNTLRAMVGSLIETWLGPQAESIDPKPIDHQAFAGGW